jgi:hypothetical protein
MKDFSLLDALRKTAVNVAVDAFSTVHQAKKFVDEASSSEGAGPPVRSARAPSAATINDFLGDVAQFGLDQVNGVLTLRARYWDDASKWLADYLFPQRSSPPPAAKLIHVRSRPGGRASPGFAATNPLAREAKVVLRASSLQNVDGGQAGASAPLPLPPSIELAPGQPWVFSVELNFNTSADGQPLPPGRYVCLAEAVIDERVIERVLLDISLQDDEPRETAAREVAE